MFLFVSSLNIFAQLIESEWSFENFHPTEDEVQMWSLWQIIWNERKPSISFSMPLGMMVSLLNQQIEPNEGMKVSNLIPLFLFRTNDSNATNVDFRISTAKIWNYTKRVITRVSGTLLWARSKDLESESLIIISVLATKQETPGPRLLTGSKVKKADLKVVLSDCRNSSAGVAYNNLRTRGEWIQFPRKFDLNLVSNWKLISHYPLPRQNSELQGRAGGRWVWRGKWRQIVGKLSEKQWPFAGRR